MALGWRKVDRNPSTSQPGVKKKNQEGRRIALLCALFASLIRIPLIWDDPWPSGYDGWYYVLQTKSWLEGAPIFADRSLVFPVLAFFGWVSDSVVIGNKVALCLSLKVNTV